MTRRRVFGLLTALWLLLIWGHSLMSADTSAEESGWLLALLQRAAPWLTDHMVRKAAHFAEFAVLGALLLGARGEGWRLGHAFPALFGLVAAMTDETIQLFSPGRSGQITDVWLDLAGFLLSYGLLRLVSRHRQI